MPTKIEKDQISGRDTTGHEWDGVKELNTPLPSWWVYSFYATIVFSIVYMVLYPAWPWFNAHTSGLLGYSSRTELSRELDVQSKARGAFVERIRTTPIGDIRKDPRALQLRPRRRPLRLPDDMHAVPRRGWRGQQRFPQSG